MSETQHAGTVTPGQADPWQVLTALAAVLFEGDEPDDEARQRAIEILERNGVSAFAAQQPEPELTIKICEETGHVGHFARITAGYPGHSASFCLLARQAAFLSQALAHAVPGPQSAPELAALARAVLQIADAGDMPDSYWGTDSRIKLARDVLGVPADGRHTHCARWEE